MFPFYIPENTRKPKDLQGMLQGNIHQNVITFGLI